MARRRNEETIAAISCAARKIMVEHGYEAATFSALANETGVARTTVQHYVQRKEALATEFMQAVADLSFRHAREIASDDEDPLAKQYVAGQISHGAYYATPGMRKFIYDISADRRLQHDVAPNFEDTAFELLGIDPALVTQEVRYELDYALGGIYETHFLIVRDDRFPVIHRVGEPFSRILGRLMGKQDKQIDALIEKYRLDNNSLLEIGRQIAQELLEEA